ncbi:hypothetical protein NDU88_011992 [Pleurodeles waltl]|uniref:Uncharacterized protein n=1 Tax=Pleurodeles waltl TaxID=8319 RepID=A0AAV7QYX2_PLEWA|nr:hypothetical protein NDU88_011992 [Pleurodeles waltl]
MGVRRRRGGPDLWLSWGLAAPLRRVRLHCGGPLRCRPPLGEEKETLIDIALLRDCLGRLAPPAGSTLRDRLFPECQPPCRPAITFVARGVEWCHPESLLRGLHRGQ